MAFHPDDLDLYVMDALPDERRTVVEAHVASCAECAAALAREARLELQLLELVAAADAATDETQAAPLSIARPAPAPRRSKSPTRRRRRRAVWSAIAAAAVVAAGVLGALRLWPRPPSAPEQIVVACPFDDSARSCIEHARQHGLFVQFPIARPVPIYENASAALGAIATAF
jgi:anti-sigma factor RsiW